MIKVDGINTAFKDSLSIKAGQLITIPTGNHSWYGHGFNHQQSWPLKEIQNDFFAVNNIQSPLWMNSNGEAFLADTCQAIQVDFLAERSLNISCKKNFRLRYFKAQNLSELWKKLASILHWQKPKIKDDMWGDSLFCTWTQYPRAINQERIINMARDIQKYDYPCSTIIIDDRWESCFGELEFGNDFPDPKSMITQLHDMGFKVWLWVTPFVNCESKYFSELEKSLSLVPHKNGKEAAKFRWWGGKAGLVDLTQYSGKSWYKSKLNKLKDLGVDGFKIDGGDAKYMPSDEITKWDMDPSVYSDLLLEIFEEIVPGNCESRAAWMSQNRNIIWRLGGKDSHWGEDNGLKALLNLSLHLSLCGYDALIPDMIPGRVQTMNSDDPLVKDELMIRWTELSCFMPFVQFSYFPWNYCKETENTIKGFAKVHKALQNYIANMAKDNSAPLIQPMEFAFPNSGMKNICNQYLLGPDLMICPVLDPGINQRKVIIPNDEFIDAWSGQEMKKGEFIIDTPCPGIGLFVRKQNKQLFNILNSVLKNIARASVVLDTCTSSHKCGLNRDLSVTG
ncbi:glycoside hydrolase family 31 protein [Lentisphaera marina]|uniref:glycoside hydrolase family 31 protein n=1 Tax=Lentisphaera marina TaxID=1111041 RepID=UPI002366281F|nr:glycoside hydrolase family 31 protein [Lentisphaera marina]MDD7984689.1 glycoside hydrolase family 31 protein [Lentisphaera marina]